MTLYTSLYDYKFLYIIFILLFSYSYNKNVGPKSGIIFSCDDELKLYVLLLNYFSYLFSFDLFYNYSYKTSLLLEYFEGVY